MLTRIEIDRQRFQTFAGAPVAVGNHRNRVTEIHHLDDSRQIFQCRFIHTFDLATEYRCATYCRVFQSRRFCIDTELRRAIDLLWHVETSLAGAHDAKLILGLQHRIQWCIELGRSPCELSEM